MIIPAALDVYAARRRIAGHLTPTPLRRSAWISSAIGADVSLKLETVNPTSSFKIRGALNALLALRDRAAGSPAIVAASAGNHGQAIAMAGRLLGMRCTVFTPSTAPASKTSAIAAMGADLRRDAPDYDAAERLAREHARETGATYISPYNHADVIAGAGTIGLEIAEADPSVDLVIVPLGGGGLASGVGLAVRAAAPRARVVGVEVQASSPFTVSLARGVITLIEPQPTLADGLAGNLESESMTFPLVQRVVDEVVTVGEGDVARAVRWLAAEEHLIAEGSAATVVAALLAGAVPVPGMRVAAVITGANIDLERLVSLLAN